MLNPQCLVFGSFNSCRIMYLLRASYSLAKRGIRTFASKMQLDFHVGGDQWHFISTALT